jgi:predicted nucleic acid-binding protein
VKLVLVDTGCIVALLDRSERRHEQCVEALGQLDAPLATCEAVVAESCYLLRGVKGAAEAVLENVAQGVFLLLYRAAPRASALRALLKKYADVPMDFADACLVDMAAELGTGRILTLDRDFQVYRWGRHRPFEFLLDL